MDKANVDVNFVLQDIYHSSGCWKDRRREQNLLYIVLVLRNIQYTIYINIEFPPVQIGQIDPNRKVNICCLVMLYKQPRCSFFAASPLRECLYHFMSLF